MLIKTKPKINELKQKKGSVDIIILNYNRENFIDRAIRSAIDQQISIDRNSKVIVIGSGKDGLPIILGNQ